MHGHHLFHFDDAGVGVHFDFRHLHASNAAISEIWRLALVWVLTAHCERHSSKFGASFLPTEGVTGVALHAHFSIHTFQLIRLNAERGRNFGKERVARIHGRAARGRGYAADGRGSAGAS